MGCGNSVSSGPEYFGVEVILTESRRAFFRPHVLGPISSLEGYDKRD